MLGVVLPRVPLLAIVFLTAAPAAPQPPVAEPMRVVVHPGSGAAGMDTSPRTFEVPPGRNVVVQDREWVGPVEGASVEVVGAPPGVRVQVQYETSVRIMNARPRDSAGFWSYLPSPVLAFEGPGLDLRDWKHFTSRWVDLERDPEGRYRVGVLREEERRRFPPVDRAELLDAVQAAGGFAWANLVQDVSGPLDFPSTVGLSAIRLRLLHGDPEAAFVVEFAISFGC